MWGLQRSNKDFPFHHTEMMEEEPEDHTTPPHMAQPHFLQPSTFVLSNSRNIMIKSYSLPFGIIIQPCNFTY